MTGFQVYTWRGVPIHDIKSWARERGEQMVVVDHMVREPVVYVDGSGIVESHEELEMPESFFNGMVFGIAGGGKMETYTEVRRYDP